MSIFAKILGQMADAESRLGNPLCDPGAIARRQAYFAALRGGKGFRQPPREKGDGVHVSARGTKRREAIRAQRAAQPERAALATQARAELEARR